MWLQLQPFVWREMWKENGSWEWKVMPYFFHLFHVPTATSRPKFWWRLVIGAAAQCCRCNWVECLCGRPRLVYTVADWRSSVYDTFHSKWLDYQVHGIIMGDYCAPARGTMEIMCPEGHIMPPKGCIMPPEGCRRPEVEAARGRHNATRGWHNVSWGAAWFPLARGQGRSNHIII